MIWLTNLELTGDYSWIDKKRNICHFYEKNMEKKDPAFFQLSKNERRPSLYPPFGTINFILMIFSMNHARDILQAISNPSSTNQAEMATRSPIFQLNSIQFRGVRA